jgi:hypothetical protein
MQRLLRWSLGHITLLACAVVACEDDPVPATAPPNAGIDAGTTSSSSGGSSSGSVPAPATVPLAGAGGAFCDKTLGVLVRAMEACCTAEDQATQDYRFTHDLAAALVPVCTEALEGSITRARVLERATERDACYAAYADRYGPTKCANITQTFSDPAGTSCREAFAGVGKLDAPCMGDHECEDGLTCVGYTKTTDGKCMVPPAIGEACGAARSDGGSSGATSLELGHHPACATGAECDAVDRTCVAAQPDVSKGDENASCANSDGCKPHLYCDASTKKCLAKKIAGGTCTGATFVTECIGRCDAPGVGQPGTCVSFCGSP